jgi:polyisoprenyl-phosphate glycosyltransferase
MLLSLVVPVYNEEANITEFVRQAEAVQKELPAHNFEIVFVDDGSTDQTATRIRELIAAGKKIVLLSLSRQFGHQAALDAGISEASGDAIITMDGDLQHPPAEIPGMVKEFLAGFDVVHMCRNSEKRIFKNLVAQSFYKISSFSNKSGAMVPGDFRLFSRRVADIMIRIPEKNKIFRALTPTLGFRQQVLFYEQPGRFAGKPKYSFGTSWSLAYNILFRFGTLPLNFVFWFGLCMAVISFIAGLWKIIDKLFISENIVPGYTDTIVAILFLSGCILLAIGINGSYLRILIEQTRDRPAYIIREKVSYDRSAKVSNP